MPKRSFELQSGWERTVTFALLSYDEARQFNPKGDCWMNLAQNAALGAHTLILEDGPEVQRVPGPHSEEGGKILERMRTQGCLPPGDSDIPIGAGGQDTVSGTPPDPAGIV